MRTAVAIAAALVATAFAMATYERWLARRRRHELAWSGALAMFAVAAAALAAGSELGWSPLAFRVFFLFGAILNVPFLALGTVYLLGGERRGDAAALVLAISGAFAAGVIAIAPLTGPLPEHELVRGADVFGPLPRVLAAVASGGGALVIFGGAVWSAARVRRGRSVVANGLIAAGTLVLSGSGLLNSVLGEMTAFAVTLLVGISILFGGFLVATAPPTRSTAATAALGAPASRPAPAAARQRT